MIKEPQKPCPFCQQWLNIDDEVCKHCRRNIMTGEVQKLVVKNKQNINPVVNKFAIAVFIFIFLSSFISSILYQFSEETSESLDSSNVQKYSLDEQEVLAEVRNYDPEEAYVAAMAQGYCEIVQPLMEDEDKMEKLLNDKQGNLRYAQIEENMQALENIGFQHKFDSLEALMRVQVASQNWKKLEIEALEKAIYDCDFDLKEYKKFQKSDLRFFEN